MSVVDTEERELPRFFGIVADLDDDGQPSVVAWGHQIGGQAVTSWRVADGWLEVMIFASAEAALETAEALYPAELVWIEPREALSTPVFSDAPAGPRPS